MERQLTPKDLENAVETICEKCEHNFFAPVFTIKRISALVSPTGQEINVPMQTFACAKCGHVNKNFLP